MCDVFSGTGSRIFLTDFTLPLLPIDIYEALFLGNAFNCCEFYFVVSDGVNCFETFAGERGNGSAGWTGVREGDLDNDLLRYGLGLVGC